MPLLSRALGLWAIGKTFSSTTPLFMRLLAGMAVITILAVIAAMLSVVLLIGLLWFVHAQLLTQGVSPGLALLAVGELIAVLLAAMLVIARHYWRKIRFASRQLAYLQSPLSGRLSTIGNAFMDGFLSPAPRR